MLSSIEYLGFQISAAGLQPVHVHTSNDKLFYLQASVPVRVPLTNGFVQGFNMPSNLSKPIAISVLIDKFKGMFLFCFYITSSFIPPFLLIEVMRDVFPDGIDPTKELNTCFSIVYENEDIITYVNRKCNFNFNYPFLSTVKHP